jgi:IS5 family transposase
VIGGITVARRRIGQEQLRGITSDRTGAGALDRIAGLIDWSEIDSQLVDIYAAPRGEHGWPPLALFRAVLLAVWHDLSDVKLAEALGDRVSFRRFCASRLPSRRRNVLRSCVSAELVGRGLDRALFETITRQLSAKSVAVRTGTLVDATLIASASVHHDADARWAGHRRRKPVHGYKAHVATDEGGGLILGVEVTSANMHDAAELDAVLPGEPGNVYGDSAFNGSRAQATIAARGGRALIVQTGTWPSGLRCELFRQERTSGASGALHADAIRHLTEEQRRDRVARHQREAKERRDMRARHPIPTWEDYLEAQATRGNEETLAALRSRTRRRTPFGSAAPQGGGCR